MSELNTWEVRITVTRHGPKDGFEGPLTETGKNVIAKYYLDLYQGVGFDPEVQRIVQSSPVNRAVETARIFEAALESKGAARTGIVLEPRLSEGGLVGFVHSLTEAEQKDWFRHWYNSTEGETVVSQFAAWLLEQCKIKRAPGYYELNAFSHGPVMAGFILHLENNMHISILGDTHDDRLELQTLFYGPKIFFDYLSTIQFDFNVRYSQELHLSFRGQSFVIPLLEIEKIAKIKHE